ncbi:hypothetical protein ACGFX2_24135 [Streptomyces goshikiensis]|uniref:hypothetical protein n=1 Tax=Streptomyces goshikiensis TaxID=1942 RepID=UPI003713C4FC
MQPVGQALVAGHLNRVGGSVGTAVLAVIPQNALAGGDPGTAYAHTFGWALAFGVLTLVPAALHPRHAPGRSRPPSPPADRRTP